MADLLAPNDRCDCGARADNPRGDGSNGGQRGWRPRFAARTLGVVAAALGLLLTSCYPGSYPLDVFPEMHYQPSFRPHEPPRLAAPAEAVPVTGRQILPTDFAAAAALRNPLEPAPDSAQRATSVYRVNCLPCHGPEGHGNGFVAQYFQRAQVPPPVDFALARVRQRQDGELFFIISNGFGNMPPFGHLLTDEERWLLVNYIRGVQAQSPQS